MAFPPDFNNATARLPPPGGDAHTLLAEQLPALQVQLDWPAAAARARPWVQAVREQPPSFWALESLLREYPVSSAEGRALMRLAEALLRVPDEETAAVLAADQLGAATFGPRGDGSGHPLWAGLSDRMIGLAKTLLPADAAGAGMFKRLGARTVVAAVRRALQLLGRQFVLGRSIEEALAEAGRARRRQAGLRFSFDMLGEGARADADALRYHAAYAQAIAAIATVTARTAPGGEVEAADGISVKLSALSARYEETQRERVLAELLPRAWALVDAAARANLPLTLDAEETDRLELSLDMFDALAARIAQHHPAWRGFGLAVQAYQPRARAVIDEAARIARAHGLRCMVRLVKGAYWDGEIKRAQELGLAAYPVHMHKAHTDLSYLACAQALLAHRGTLYAQFATHNAATIAAVLQLAGGADGDAGGFELQRLHGMGEGIYREVMQAHPALPVRVYAPVGAHRDLLAYLVRRLLENGANASFVHQLADVALPVDVLLASPFEQAQQPPLPMVPLPATLYGTRANSIGIDLAARAERQPLLEALASTAVPTVADLSSADVPAAMARLHAGFAHWNATPLAARTAVLRRAADALQTRLPEFCALLVREAHKTLADSVAEVREAIDFCRYYAEQAELRLAPQQLPGPTGERNELRLRGRGVFVCISPWNFPLAIFAGQVTAALVAGNAVAAKPAEQTPAVAQRFVALLNEAGVPVDALALLPGPGDTVGAAAVADVRTAGVCFTGSTAVARHIHRALAAQDGPIVPLIAETGGLNAMVVDSSALPEQVVDAVVQSAFRSAGQRCSALRLLCLHDSIADAVLEMLRGAMAELRTGDPAALATDVGPVIDAAAQAALTAHIERLHREAQLIAASPPPAAPAGRTDLAFITPIAFEITTIADLREEIFGPVLHVVRWRGPADAVIEQINALGYGLTLGLQTRIDSRATRLAQAARAGNVYVNRNMVGAVVGVQPFGGEGLSGTGPKAGGPHYLYRFCSEQMVTVNTAAAGGNAELLAAARVNGD